MAALQAENATLQAENKYLQLRTELQLTEKEQLEQELQQVRLEAEQRILQRENELAAELGKLRTGLAAAEAQAEIVIQNDAEIHKVLLTAITSKSKGGTYNGSNASSVKEAIEKVLPLLTTDP